MRRTFIVGEPYAPGGVATRPATPLLSSLVSPTSGVLSRRFAVPCGPHRRGCRLPVSRLVPVVLVGSPAGGRRGEAPAGYCGSSARDALVGDEAFAAELLARFLEREVGWR